MLQTKILYKYFDSVQFLIFGVLRRILKCINPRCKHKEIANKLEIVLLKYTSNDIKLCKCAPLLLLLLITLIPFLISVLSILPHFSLPLSISLSFTFPSFIPLSLLSVPSLHSLFLSLHTLSLSLSFYPHSIRQPRDFSFSCSIKSIVS